MLAFDWKCVPGVGCAFLSRSINKDMFAGLLCMACVQILNELNQLQGTGSLPPLVLADVFVPNPDIYFSSPLKGTSMSFLSGKFMAKMLGCFGAPINLL